MGKRFDRHFTTEGIQTANKYNKRCQIPFHKLNTNEN